MVEQAAAKIPNAFDAPRAPAGGEGKGVASVAERTGRRNGHPPETASHVGIDIRAMRKNRNLTLSALSEAVGRSIGWLSQVERGQRDPSISDLKALARQFGIPVSFFFRNGDAPEEERGIIVRADQRAAIGSAGDGLREELLSPDLAGDFEMIRSEFAAGAEQKEMPARDTQDGGYVVSGELELTISGRTFRLKAGDSFRFDRQPYGWANRGKVPAVVIWVISPPVY